MNIREADSYLRHLQRTLGFRPVAHGPKGDYPVTWGPTEDKAEIAHRIDSVRDHSFVFLDERGKSLLAFGDTLRDELSRGEG